MLQLPVAVVAGAVAAGASGLVDTGCYSAAVVVVGCCYCYYQSSAAYLPEHRNRKGE